MTTGAYDIGTEVWVIFGDRVRKGLIITNEDFYVLNLREPGSCTYLEDFIEFSFSEVFLSSDELLEDIEAQIEVLSE